jgi:hypothetical protein
VARHDIPTLAKVFLNGENQGEESGRRDGRRRDARIIWKYIKDKLIHPIPGWRSPRREQFI